MKLRGQYKGHRADVRAMAIAASYSPDRLGYAGRYPYASHEWRALQRRMMAFIGMTLGADEVAALSTPFQKGI